MNRAREVTLVLCLRPGQVLLGVKRGGFGEGRVVAPGGHREAGETAAEAAARELAEEVHIRVEPEALEARGIVRFRFEQRPEWNMDASVFAAREAAWTGVASESDELSPAWYDVDALPYAAMWADAPEWLPAALDPDGPRIDFTVTYAADNATVARVESHPQG